MSGQGRALPVVAAATGGTPRAPALSFPKHNRQDRVARQVRPVPARASAGASLAVPPAPLPSILLPPPHPRSEEHTSELQSLMRISYAVFCLKKKTTKYQNVTTVY